MLVAIGAIGSKIFDDYSRSDLKRYCRQQGNAEFFNLVRDRYQKISLASETLVALAGSFAMVSLALTVIASPESGLAEAPAGVMWRLLEVGMPDSDGNLISTQVWISVITIAVGKKRKACDRERTLEGGRGAKTGWLRSRASSLTRVVAQ